ncbi:MAG: DUF4105 domain-containing protein [Bacteroidia bacterium]|nr:DUF4105 domain-containing protein [Bacteroidia bacterium]
MKKILFVSSFLLMLYLPGVFSQPASDTVVYLLTCGPGTETYSIYGHSAIRIVIPEKNSDMVYNWGVFYFDSPNFAWKFAKGRLDYWLGVVSLQNFLQDYSDEQRFVYSQRINLDASETKQLIALINDNLKPENVKYRYDFFYDDCSTRIRDLLEKSIGKKLLYPPAETGEVPTFRKMVGKYQNPYHWLKFGVDLIMGSSGDKKASFRDRMFLPLDMQNGLSETVVNRNGKMIPLLQNPVVILDYDPPVIKKNFLTSPEVVFTILLIIVLILSALLKSKKIINLVDIFVFSVFSILALLMIFFNFFTNHQQMKWNLNIIWLNPIIILCLVILILKKTGSIWFRILFYITISFLVLHFFLPQEFNIAFIPLVVILLIRSSVRAGFDWNPLTLK